jgi:hypothetical protein
VNHRGLRAVTLAGAALVIALASAACVSTEQPTPIYVIVTPTPVATQAVATPTPEPTPLTTFTPWPTLVPTPTPTLAPTAAPSSGPTSPAGACVGKASNQAFFLQAAKGVKFTVYCATSLGSGWGLASSPQTSWSGNKSGGTVLIYYQYRSTATRLEVCEGTFAASLCSGNTGGLGAASFGGLSGQLYSTTDGFAIRVAPGTNHAYTLVGHNVSQSTLVSVGGNMAIVPKT